MSKRDYDRKLREDQEAAAHVFQEFINIFQDTPASSKTFVKSGVLYADKNQLTSSEGQLYKPTPLIKNSSTLQNALECAKILTEDKPIKDKPKSNLELLKEELKLRHTERREKDKLRDEVSLTKPAVSYFDGGDPKSTNLFIANLSTKISEMDLMEQFGVYGCLASVKIMWPRGEDRFQNLNTNCGFVAFMSRKDAERALNHMKSRNDMRVGWGKSVELPAYPVYIPPELLKMFLPPPQSGLPFNAQTADKYKVQDLDHVLFDSIVKVTIPLNKRVLALVHRTIEFVVKEGPMFEAIIMNNEMGNPDFNFLFDNKSPTHVYYRWKLFTILQGEATKEWSMKPFRMFLGGSIWCPPVAPNYQAGMPDELIKEKFDINLLSDVQCDRLIGLIQKLTLSRSSISEAMAFCLAHHSALNDSIGIILESLSNSSTKPPNKIARFYLLYDVVINAHRQNVKIVDIRTKIETIMDEMFDFLTKINKEVDKSLFGSRAVSVANQLVSHGFLHPDSIKRFEEYIHEACQTIDDGNSSNDEPLDGANLVRRSLKNSSNECIITPTCLKAKQETKLRQEYFVPSKWDTIDPEEVETQSVSSSQLYFIECAKEQKTSVEKEGTPKEHLTKDKVKYSKKRRSRDEETKKGSPERPSRKHRDKKKKSRK